MLEFLLGRGGVFADTEAEHRYVNQIREAAGAFDHLQSRKCGPAGRPCGAEVERYAWLPQLHLPAAQWKTFAMYADLLAGHGTHVSSLPVRMGMGT